MKKFISSSTLFLLFGSSWSQNVGINTNAPTHAKLEINGTVGAAVAMFGADKYGVTIEADNPEIGFNYYFNNVPRTIKAGYASLIGMNPASGDLYIGNFNGNQSSVNYGAINGFRNNIIVFQTGEVRVAGSENFTHFFYGGNEDTYIRGGKTGSNVIINDVAAGRVGLGTGALEPQTMLTIKGAQYYGGIDVTANGGPIGAIYAHGLNGTPAIYLDGPIKVNTLSTYRTAYRLTLNSNAGTDGHFDVLYSVNHDGTGDILINNMLTNNDPGALIFYSFVNGSSLNDSQSAFHSYLTYNLFGDNKWRINFAFNDEDLTSFQLPSQVNIMVIKTN